MCNELFIYDFLSPHKEEVRREPMTTFSVVRPTLRLPPQHSASCLLVHVRAIACTCKSNCTYMYKQASRRVASERSVCQSKQSPAMSTRPICLKKSYDQ